MTIRLVERRRSRPIRMPFLTPAEYAAALGIGMPRVYKWIERGHLTVYQVGPDTNPRYLIPTSELRVGRRRLKEGTAA